MKKNRGKIQWRMLSVTSYQIKPAKVARNSDQEERLRERNVSMLVHWKRAGFCS